MTARTCADFHDIRVIGEIRGLLQTAEVLRNPQSAIRNPQSTVPFASRPAFTLFELILAIALSATLMVLIGAAINLYLLQVDASRTRIEESQLARSILSTVAADVRAAYVYQTQDTSAVAQLAASAAAFDVDAIDQSGSFTGGAFTTAGGTSAGSASGGFDSGDSGTSSSGSFLADGADTSALAPGLNGTLQELIIDATRLPGLNELLPAVPQQSTTSLTPVTNVPRPSDLKTVRYYLRPGDAVLASDAAVTSLDPEAQLRVGGLVRQTIDRAVREFAEQTGNSALLDSGQVLVAPEVVHLEFRYFDGTAAVEEWIMRDRQSMPRAIEVRIWLADAETEEDLASREMSRYGIVAGPPEGARMYSQTVELPMAQTPAAGTADSSTDATGLEDTTAGGSDTSAFEN